MSLTYPSSNDLHVHCRCCHLGQVQQRQLPESPFESTRVQKHNNKCKELLSTTDRTVTNECLRRGVSSVENHLGTRLSNSTIALSVAMAIRCLCEQLRGCYTDTTLLRIYLSYPQSFASGFCLKVGSTDMYSHCLVVDTYPVLLRG